MIDTKAQRISLDFNQNSYKTIYAKQYDDKSRRVVITCLENGQRFDVDRSLTAQIKILTPDNRSILDTLTVQEDHTLLFILSQNILAAPGKAAAEVRLYDHESLISTMIFYIMIESAVYPDDTLIASDEFNALTDVMNKALTDYNYVMESALTSATAAASSASDAADSAAMAATSALEASERSDEAGAFSLEAAGKADEAKSFSLAASEKAAKASSHAVSSADSAVQSQSWAVGGTGTRTDEDIDNSKYYYEQSRHISENFSGALRPMGTVAFADLPELSSTDEGDMYNISDQFTTTDDFKEGANHIIPPGSNIYKTADGKWDILAGTPVTGVKGNAESSYRKGNVNITSADIGLGNVVNVSTNDQTPTFIQSSSRTNITSGEKLSSIFGKIMKWFADLKAVAFSGSYNDLSDRPAIPSVGNGTITITQNGMSKGTFTVNQSSNTTIALTDTNTQTVTGIKGSSEGSYLTGNVNITPSNIGLGNVNNTADANKSVKYATSAGSASNANWASSAGNADTLDGYHASSFASASHSHSYLPLGGGTMSGHMRMRGNTTYYGSSDQCGIYADGDGRTMKLIAPGYLNLMAPGIQCRDYKDESWAGRSASGFHPPNNAAKS